VNVIYEKQGHIGYIKFNRPEARNAFSPQMVGEICEILDGVNSDNDVWALILGSSTPGMFSAGADLKLTVPLLNGLRKPESEYDFKILNSADFFRKGTFKANDTDRPIVAAIDGPCLAGGFEIVMSTDIRIATERSVFGLPEVTRGIVAWGGGTSKLAKQIPYVKAMEMNLTGRKFSAREMYEMGFLTKIVGERELWGTAEEYAQRIASNAPLAVRAAKQSIKKCLGHPLDVALEIEQAVTRHIRFTEDAKEGPRAFSEKREPRWKAR
jgi:enoyl-CoA hydratase